MFNPMTSQFVSVAGQPNSIQGSTPDSVSRETHRYDTCWRCKGKGTVIWTRRVDVDDFRCQGPATCEECRGAGEVLAVCDRCPNVLADGDTGSEYIKELDREVPVCGECLAMEE